MRPFGKALGHLNVQLRAGQNFVRCTAMRCDSPAVTGPKDQDKMTPGVLLRTTENEE